MAVSTDPPSTNAGILHGRLAMVTGGAQGIGNAIADAFSQAGARVARADISFEATAAKGSDLLITLDVSNERSWERSIETVEEHFGGIDILVNNAGLFTTNMIEHEERAAFQRLIAVNQIGVFLGMRSALRLLRKSDHAAIINMSSAAGLVGARGTLAYSATKWAVRGMTKVAALEFAPLGIRVNSIHPAAVSTNMLKGKSSSPGASTPMGRPGRADEIAQMALFLASDAASYSTGAEFVCDGGHCAQ